MPYNINLNNIKLLKMNLFSPFFNWKPRIPNQISNENSNINDSHIETLTANNDNVDGNDTDKQVVEYWRSLHCVISHK